MAHAGGGPCPPAGPPPPAAFHQAAVLRGDPQPPPPALGFEAAALYEAALGQSQPPPPASGPPDLLAEGEAAVDGSRSRSRSPHWSCGRSPQRPAPEGHEDMAEGAGRASAAAGAADGRRLAEWITPAVVSSHSQHESAFWAALHAWRAAMDSWHSLEEALEEAGAPPGTRQEANETYRAAWRQYQAEYQADMRRRPPRGQVQGATSDAPDGSDVYAWALLLHRSVDPHDL